MVVVVVAVTVVIVGDVVIVHVVGADVLATVGSEVGKTQNTLGS